VSHPAAAAVEGQTLPVECTGGEAARLNPEFKEGKKGQFPVCN